VPKAGALEAAVATGERGEILQAFRALGGTCGDCHDSYRAD
jgi:cytochrome c556